MERVWDYPRPPALVPCERRVRIELGGMFIVDSHRALRVLETSHPPGWYLPREDWAPGSLQAAPGSSSCEWKGLAAYLTVVGGDRSAPGAAWTYPNPAPGYEPLRDTVAVYPAAMDACTVAGERVRPQEGTFYGGWVTSEVVGPFKGGPGSTYW